MDSKSSWSLSVFIIKGFSPCLKRLLLLHPGCQGCFNFSKLSPPLFSQQWQEEKKAVIKIAAFVSSFTCVSPPTLVHPDAKNKNSAGLTRSRSSLVCFYWILFVSASCSSLFFFAIASILSFLWIWLVDRL